MSARPLRAMWLLNHTAARAFEIPMLKRVGVDEIFLPKSFPQEHDFRSASIDHSEDANLTIPAQDLELLNSTDWYKPVRRAVWDIVNKHFDILFFILRDGMAVETIARHFQGIALLRAYGLPSFSYSKLISLHQKMGLALEKKAQGFLVAEAYENLAKVEPDWLARKSVYLPLGLERYSVEDDWSGKDDRLLFICPEIRCNSYYRSVYEKFIEDFKGIPCVIGGAQPIHVNDLNVTGFLPADQFERNMRELKVMFYHSTEPRHVHYHPFEAVRHGMPLVFMGGGLLERLAGKKLPGQANSVREARLKIERILADNRGLIDDIRESQAVLLDAMSPKRAEPHWRQGFKTILSRLPQVQALAEARAAKMKRVAVIVPVEYRGGSMRGAKLLAEALQIGSRQCGDEAEIILSFLDDDSYSHYEFEDLPDDIQLRPFRWQKLGRQQARDSMRLAGYESWAPDGEAFYVADDGINNLLDCDAWIIVSDRILYPLIPLRPTIHIIYDCIQRYLGFLDRELVDRYADAVLRADKVLVTTDFTHDDVINYIGVPRDRVAKLPMLAPSFSSASRPRTKSRYCVWSTNRNPHKNHERALEALSIYYGELRGELGCRVTGVNTDGIFDDEDSGIGKIYKRDSKLQKHVEVCGELPSDTYRTVLAESAFLWHPALIDNGTFSVIEAASLGVPSLSSDYPAMREIDDQFSLGLKFADATSPRKMAAALKWMEQNLEEAREILPSREKLETQSISNLASAYWLEVREVL